jgi:hypothetical protein
MGGLFSNDSDGWVHDCSFPEPTQGATFICSECEVKHFTVVHRQFHQWVWVSAGTGKVRL